MADNKRAAMAMNDLAAEMNNYGDAHIDLIGRLIALTDDVANQPNPETVALKAELVVDFEREGLNDWAGRLKDISW